MRIFIKSFVDNEIVAFQLFPVVSANPNLPNICVIDCFDFKFPRQADRLSINFLINKPSGNGSRGYPGIAQQLGTVGTDGLFQNHGLLCWSEIEGECGALEGIERSEGHRFRSGGCKRKFVRGFESNVAVLYRNVGDRTCNVYSSSLLLKVDVRYSVVLCWNHVFHNQVLGLDGFSRTLHSICQIFVVHRDGHVGCGHVQIIDLTNAYRCRLRRPAGAINSVGGPGKRILGAARTLWPQTG